LIPIFQADGQTTVTRAQCLQWSEQHSQPALLEGPLP